MSDHRSRALGRAAAQADPEADPGPHAALKRQLIREGASAPWGLERGAHIPGCTCPGGCACHRYTDAHRVTYPAAPLRDVIRLRAYAGCGVSREVVPMVRAGGKQPRGALLVPEPLDLWTTGLLRLAAALPGVEVAGVACECRVAACSWCNRNGVRQTGTFMCEKHYGCPNCNGTGQRTHTTPAERWLSVVVAVAVGRAVWRQWWRTECETPCEGDCSVCGPPWRALDAAEAWTRCPCPERAETCDQIVNQHAWGAADWQWRPCEIPNGGDPAPYLLRTLTSAAEHITPDAVRAAACAAVLAVVPL